LASRWVWVGLFRAAVVFVEEFFAGAFFAGAFFVGAFFAGALSAAGLADLLLAPGFLLLSSGVMKTSVLDWVADQLLQGFEKNLAHQQRSLVEAKHGAPAPGGL